MGQNGSGFWAGERDGLVGRDETLTTLRELLDTGSRTAVVTGIPGAGKTSVLEVVARAEAADGRLVLPLTCHASERPLAFGMLVDLLMLAPGAESILESILPTTSRAFAVDALRLRLEVLAWLERLGEERPVVVILDDAQWCDESSLSVLGFVSRRLAGTRTSLLAAARGDAPPPALVGNPDVALPALDDRDAAVLLRRAGVHLDSLAAPVVIERAAGNPLALLELGRAAVLGRAVEATPSSVESAFGQQVALLPERTRAVLLLAAAGDGEVSVLARAVGPDRLPDDLAPAEDAGLVRVSDRVVRFRHPLVRSATYGAASTADRLAAHARLSEAHHDDPERSAWHRAEATVVPDEQVAEALALASGLAQRRGATPEAARLMIRAAELSVDRSTRDGRMLEAVLINTSAGRFDWVAEIGTRLRLESPDPVIQIRAAHLAAYALAQMERSGDARRALVHVLERLEHADPALGWSTLTTLAVLAYRTGRNTDEVAAWLDAYDRASETAPETENSFLVPACRAWIRMQIDPVSRPADILELIRDAPPSESEIGQLAAAQEMMLGAAAWMLDEPALATERLEAAVAIMRREDKPGQMTQTLVALALVRFSVGDFDGVDQAARLVLDIAEATNQSWAITDAAELQARVAAVRGDTERARELCDRLLLELTPGESVALEATLRTTMSWVRLAERDVQGAWQDVRWLFDDDGEPRHVHISYRELGHYAASAVRAGATDELLRVLEVAERRLAVPRAYHRLELARARALATGEDAEQWHVAAVTDPEAARWPFELASAQLEYGAWLRRRHRQAEARLQLGPAVETFTRLGARPSADLARAELRAAGVATEDPERSAWADLTGQEREVVRLAASGMTNPEIAAALYLSPRTVSTHLYNAFPKLGVTSRAQLRDVVPEMT